MRAMVLDRPGVPLREVERPAPVPGPGQVLLEVRACGVCRTDLHVVDGELPDLGRPVVLSGGLDAGNVGGAIRAVKPWAVDVSSGVESTRGVKDAARIEEFVRSVRDADASAGG